MNRTIIVNDKKISKESQKKKNIIEDAMNRSFEKYAEERKRKDTKRNIALIGIGPHAKRIYLHYIKKHKENLELVVELESERSKIRKYLDENGFKKTKIFCIPDKFKDNLELPNDLESNLIAVMKTLDITHIFISTEPKAHNMYVKFALKHDINVLTDKPITVVKNMTSKKSIDKVREQYYQILKDAETSKAECKVMCQRQYHRGYEKVKQILNEVVSDYQIPITHIDIYHCDGNWEMMHDLNKENHPYKYGYGKLFHSGYHFIDLLSDFIKINNQLPDNKRIYHGEIYSNCFTPNDEKAIVGIEDYKRLFKNQEIPEYYYENKNPKFNKYGEKNFYGLMKFTNANHQLITEVSMNLLHYGFSRRGWIQSKNFYKENGRIRHERININVGPLLNIQVHSYQSKEIKDRLDCKTEEQFGGLEHFDIYIYRNVDLIGGKPFEKISLGDLYSEKEKENILGFNELSREHYLSNFLKGKCDRGDIKEQALGIEILHACAMGLHNHYNNKKKAEKIIVRNNYTYPNIIEELKRYSGISDKKLDKEVCYWEPIYRGLYEYSVYSNYIKTKDSYEVYLVVSDEKTVASRLLYKEIKNKYYAKLYAKLITFLVRNYNMKTIARLITKKKI